jgi:hypothetical protein
MSIAFVGPTQTLPDSPVGSPTTAPTPYFRL